MTNFRNVHDKLMIAYCYCCQLAEGALLLFAMQFVRSMWRCGILKEFSFISKHLMLDLNLTKNSLVKVFGNLEVWLRY